MFHCAENLLLIHYRDVDQNVGRKFVICNAYQHIARKPKVGHIPIYNDNNSLFGKCDRFSANLTERTWYHKHGGRNKLGDIGHQHNFAMSSILQNVFNAFKMCNDIPRNQLDFSTHCLLLANENM